MLDKLIKEVGELIEEYKAKIEAGKVRDIKLKGGGKMIEIDRETKITFTEDDAWDLTQLAKYVIEVIQTGTSKGYGYDEETIERFKKLAYRLDGAIPNEGFL